MMEKPQGELIIQALAMPSNTNPNGDIFGGWLVSQMDLAGGVLAKRISKSRAVTVAINSMVFKKPVHVGNLVGCYVSLVTLGRTSITVDVEVWTEALGTAPVCKQKVTEGRFVYVALDDFGAPKPIANPTE